jgi:hypothetical protein
MLSFPVDEGRKRVMAIVAGILVARHLKTADDLFDSKPRTTAMNEGQRCPHAGFVPMFPSKIVNQQIPQLSHFLAAEQ